ncbi:YkgJ family cysteine cluster protein [Teredinibacter purpureus]|uniref:YkgJ family cysteine cluster protein n=1 Tax=Teredinibacter purpureus TaxID=2731756 RepID=UPI0005F7D3A5|nr:YkgJ family cysteine cluster protein [Teredinibacter purpureus]
MKDCTQCGKCCIHYGGGDLAATPEEVEFWETFRPNISEYVANGRLWVDPNSGKVLDKCPWLEHDSTSEKYSCAIYYDRPEDCRHYPTSIDEMVRDECEMIEVKDLRNKNKAQKELDILMIESRPPLHGY